MCKPSIKIVKMQRNYFNCDGSYIGNNPNTMLPDKSKNSEIKR